MCGEEFVTPSVRQESRLCYVQSGGVRSVLCTEYMGLEYVTYRVEGQEYVLYCTDKDQYCHVEQNQNDNVSAKSIH